MKIHSRPPRYLERIFLYDGDMIENEILYAEGHGFNTDKGKGYLILWVYSYDSPEQTKIEEEE
jgi:hypothetical protein